jgi:protein-tyrosine phosphatase
MNISSYEEAHSDILLSSGDHATASLTSPAAYIPEEFPADRLVTDVIVGDDKFSRCGSDEYRMTRGTKPDPAAITTKSSPAAPAAGSRTDGVLAPSSNYTAFLEVLVVGFNGRVLRKRSDYFPVVETGDYVMTMDITEKNRGTDAGNSLSPFAPILYSMTGEVSAMFGLSSGLVIFCLLLFVLCFLFRRKVADSSTGSDTNSEDNQPTQSVNHTLKRSASIVTGHNHVSVNTMSTAALIPSACPHKWIGQPVFIHSLPHVFIERHADNDLLFQAEFDALPEVFADRTSIAADLPENVAKNRYPDIKCYDQTRVRLPLIDGIGSDYINADFVEGYRGRKLFICAQGPHEAGIRDFWRMIDVHRVQVIVMLTGIEEQGKIKCAQYWSDDEQADFLVSDLYVVRLQSRKCFPDFVIRSLVLRSQQGCPQEERHILQFHFLLWKDFLAPEQPSWLLRFIRRSVSLSRCCRLTHAVSPRSFVAELTSTTVQTKDRCWSTAVPESAGQGHLSRSIPCCRTWLRVIL